MTDHDAHAWVEVWFRGYGWLPFDPTPGAGRRWADVHGRVAAFDLAAAGLAAAQAVGLPASTHRRSDPGLEPNGAHGRCSRTSRAGAAAGHAGATGAGRNASLLRLLALLAVAARARRAHKTALRWGRYATRDPRRVAAACRRELTDFLVDQRIDVPRSATLHELAELVAASSASTAPRSPRRRRCPLRPASSARDAADRARRELCGCSAGAGRAPAHAPRARARVAALARRHALGRSDDTTPGADGARLRSRLIRRGI